jgi:hypothetical protein
MEVRDDDRIRKHAGVCNIIGVYFWGIPFTQYHILSPPPASRPPSRKETPRWRVLYRITRQLLHLVSTATLVSSHAVSTSTGISGCFQPGQAKVVLDPIPFVCTPRLWCGGGHTRWVERGWGVNILEDARHWIGLLQYNRSAASSMLGLLSSGT